jgi:hypothetical protein
MKMETETHALLKKLIAANMAVLQEICSHPIKTEFEADHVDGIYAGRTIIYRYCAKCEKRL